MPQIFYASVKEIHRAAFREDDWLSKQLRIYKDFKRVLERAGLKVVGHKISFKEGCKVPVEIWLDGEIKTLKVDHKADGEVTGIRMNGNDVELAMWLKDLIYQHGRDTYDFYLGEVVQPSSLALLRAARGRASLSHPAQITRQETEGWKAEQVVDQFLTAHGLGPLVDWFNRGGESQIPVDFLVNGWLLEVKSTRGKREGQRLEDRERELALKHPDAYLLTLVTFHRSGHTLDHYRLQEGRFQGLKGAEFLQVLQTEQPGGDDLRQELLAMKVQVPAAEVTPEVQPPVHAPEFPKVEQGSDQQEPIQRLREKRKWSPGHWLWNTSKWHAEKNKSE